MKRGAVILLSMVFTAGAAHAESSAKLPVESVESRKVQLQGVTTERTATQVRAHGWV